MVKFTFKGLMAPTFAPYKDDLSINLGIIPQYAKYLADRKIPGVLINGTSGEGTSLSVQERKLLTEEWSKAVKQTKQHLMVQVGGAPLPDVLELAKHAESIGADSILCLPDLYIKPLTSADLIRYLKIVGEAAPNTPLLYYHIPMFTNVNIDMGELLNEIPGKIPTFQGIKFTSRILDEGASAVKANNGKYSVFLGGDTIMAAAYTLGFDSAIATTLNIFPNLSVDILESIQQSSVVKARNVQNNLTELCRLITKHGGWVPTMKAAMNLFSPIYVGPVREPMLNLTQAQVKEMEASVKATKIL